MSTIQIPTELTVEHLLSVFKQLSPAELREFTQQFSEWQKQNGEEDEAVLVTLIQKYSLLPPVEQERYEELRPKCESTTLTEHELTEYQSLLQQLEARNVKRIEAFSALAQRRGTTLRGITTVRLKMNCQPFTHHASRFTIIHVAPQGLYL